MRWFRDFLAERRQLLYLEGYDIVAGHLIRASLQGSHKYEEARQEVQKDIAMAKQFNLMGYREEGMQEALRDIQTFLWRPS